MREGSCNCTMEAILADQAPEALTTTSGLIRFVSPEIDILIMHLIDRLPDPLHLDDPLIVQRLRACFASGFDVAQMSTRKRQWTHRARRLRTAIRLDKARFAEQRLLDIQCVDRDSRLAAALQELPSDNLDRPQEGRRRVPPQSSMQCPAMERRTCDSLAHSFADAGSLTA